MSQAHSSEVSLKPSRFFLTPERFVVGLLVLQGFLWTCTRMGWLGLGNIPGWPVLFAVAAVFLTVVLALLCFAISARFRSHLRYGMRSLLLLILAAAIACGWLAVEMQEAAREELAVDAVLDAGGSALDRTGTNPKALRRYLSYEFFTDVGSVSAPSSSDDLFGSGPRSPETNADGTPREFNEGTLLQMSKGLIKLRILGLSNTQIDDAALVHLKKFEKLEILDLSKTLVTDAGLVHLESLGSLRSLMLQGLRINGSGLAQLKDLRNLESIALGGTRINDAGVEHLRKFQKLERLFLDNTQITDAGLEVVSHFPRLRWLSLGGTTITDAGLKHVAGLTELQSLYLGHTGVGETGLPSLRRLTNLEELYLYKTQVSDSGLEHLKELKKLKRLNLNRTQVTDLGLKHLEQLTSLEELIVSSDRVSNAGMNRLRQALPSCRIHD